MADQVFNNMIVPALPTSNSSSNAYLLTFPIQNQTVSLSDMLQIQILQATFHTLVNTSLNSHTSPQISTAELHSILLSALNALNFY